MIKIAALTKNHYELLGLRPDASAEDIKAAYMDKTMRANRLMQSKYDTAYYILTDTARRQRYDLSLGIHRYRKVNPIFKVGKGVLRIILTLIDSLLTFYWCFLFVLILYFVAIGVYRYRTQEGFEVWAYWKNYADEAYLLFLLSAVDLLIHFYVRRLNRYLKNFKWEYFVKEERNGKQ